MFYLLLKGLIVGFAMAAPVGPIGVLCIRRSLHDGFKMGFVTGCGAAVADGIYGAVAAFGLTFVAHILLTYQHWIRWGGGIVLVLLGIKTLCTAPIRDTAILAPKKNVMRVFLTTFLLTLTNPMTLFSFLAVFAGVGIGSAHNTYAETALLVIAITVGSLSWFLLLSASLSWIRHKIEYSTLKWINRGSGAIIIAFGLAALWVGYTQSV